MTVSRFIIPFIAYFIINIILLTPFKTCSISLFIHSFFVEIASLIPINYARKHSWHLTSRCFPPQGKKVESTPLAMYNYFIERVKSKLHIVLAMSPIGDAFRNRLRMFPSLINCCTIDWFQVRLILVSKSMFTDCKQIICISLGLIFIYIFRITIGLGLISDCFLFYESSGNGNTPLNVIAGLAGRCPGDGSQQVPRGGWARG